MALNLSGLFHTNVSDMQAGAAGKIPEGQSGNSRPQSGTGAIHLTSGQLVSGEITGRNGEDIQIRLAKDMVLHAKMEQEITASTGQTVTFEVRSAGDGTVLLRPLFQNMAQESTVFSALSQAGIEAGEKSLQMVFSMMQEGMGIDREALQGMYRQIMSLPEADISSVVQMNRLQIPVTPENLRQFAAYKNYEHQLITSFSEMSETIPETVNGMFQAGDTAEGMALIGRLLTIFDGRGEGAGKDTAAPMPGTVPENGRIPENSGAQITAGLPGEGEQAAAKQGISGQTELPLPETGAFLTGEADSFVLQQEAAPKEGTVLPPGGDGLWQESSDAILPQDRSALAFLAEKAGAGDAAQQILSGQMGKEALYQLVKMLGEQAKTPKEQEAVRALFVSKGFQRILQDKITGQWTFTEPEMVEKEETARLYGRLNEQTRQITEALTQALRGESPLAKSVESIRENLDFMNQLNQLYSYVQLPLKLGGGNAHGDLYVYTNKKNLAAKDGSVSAFLHLDMEHLGAVDVYVAMQQENISTNFYLADEESLMLLEQHMELLTKRLTDKGYTIKTSVSLKEAPGNVMEEILETDKNISIISEQSFDVRA